ncbi:FG-GAP repeat domain-containing protein [Saltatorellus ferox]
MSRSNESQEASSPETSAHHALPFMYLFSQSPACRWRDPLGATLVALLLAGCSDPAPSSAPSSGRDGASVAARAEFTASEAAGSGRVELPEIERLYRGPTDNENLADTLDGWLGTIANKVRIRDFDGITTAFTEEFQGERLFPESGATVEGDATGEEALPMGVRSLLADPPVEVLTRDAFMADLEENLSAWSRVSQSSWRLADVQFQHFKLGETVEWGIGKLRIHIVGHPENPSGTAESGGTVVLNALATALVENREGRWVISRFRVDERELLVHSGSIYSEVSRAVGVAYDGLRFGEPGNDDVAWNGMASADVDGDGLLDVYLPGEAQGFLYRATGKGTFQEEAAARGLAATRGGTGAVFFDYDRDGDQDLAVAFVGWRELDDSLAGRPISIFENDGTGHFTDVTKAMGLWPIRIPAYSLTAFDADGDGWTDLFACGYGRMEDKTNNSWNEASNGASDLMLRNDGGERFRDVTEASGLSDRRWSYASAAADYDEDGDIDLYVGNNFGTSRLWRNRGDGTFEDVAEELGVNVQGNVMGVLWTDVDGDGRLDLYLSSPTSTSGKRILHGVERDFGQGAARGMMQMANGNKLFLGRLVDPLAAGGEGATEEQGAADGGSAEPPAKIASFVKGDMGGTSAGWSWSAASPDVDLDGHLDIVCVNGFVTGEITGDT